MKVKWLFRFLLLSFIVLESLDLFFPIGPIVPALSDADMNILSNDGLKNYCVLVHTLCYITWITIFMDFISIIGLWFFCNFARTLFVATSILDIAISWSNLNHSIGGIIYALSYTGIILTIWIMMFFSTASTYFKKQDDSIQEKSMHI